MDTFNKVLDPEDTSTGGGSACAIAGAMAAALLGMVARLSDRGAGREDLYGRSASRATELSRLLLEGSRKDYLAFHSVRSAYQLPRENDAEVEARRQAVQAAWQGAARIPLENAGRCLETLEVGVALTGKVKPQVVSDFRCGLLLAGAGFSGCLENVDINLQEIRDPAVRLQLSRQAVELRQRFAALELQTALDCPAA